MYKVTIADLSSCESHVTAFVALEGPSLMLGYSWLSNFGEVRSLIWWDVANIASSLALWEMSLYKVIYAAKVRCEGRNCSLSR